MKILFTLLAASDVYFWELLFYSETFETADMNGADCAFFQMWDIKYTVMFIFQKKNQRHHKAEDDNKNGS